MASTTDHISAQDLATIGGKLKAKATKSSAGKPSFLEDLGLGLTHLAFYPLALVTLLSESRMELLGLGQSFAIDAVLWIALLASAFLILRTKSAEAIGPVTRFGLMVFMLGFIVMIPIVIGLGVMIATAFTAGGPEALVYFAKGIFFVGFSWVYIRSY